MGCVVSWNSAEKTQDCRIIRIPAIDNLVSKTIEVE